MQNIIIELRLRTSTSYQNIRYCKSRVFLLVGTVFIRNPQIPGSWLDFRILWKDRHCKKQGVSFLVWNCIIYVVNFLYICSPVSRLFLSHCFDRVSRKILFIQVSMLNIKTMIYKIRKYHKMSMRTQVVIPNITWNEKRVILNVTFLSECKTQVESSKRRAKNLLYESQIIQTSANG